MRRLDPLIDGPRIEELVGEDDRGRRKADEVMSPIDWNAGLSKRLALERLQDGTGFDQMHVDRLRKSGDHARGAQHIAHHGAPAGAILDECVGRGGAQHLLPHHARPQSQHLTEDLRDLCRRDEVAGGADRVARGVVSARLVPQAGGHVLRHAHRPMRADVLG
jgi:hypothetical protein